MNHTNTTSLTTQDAFVYMAERRDLYKCIGETMTIITLLDKGHYQDELERH